MSVSNAHYSQFANYFPTTNGLADADASVESHLDSTHAFANFSGLIYGQC